MRSEKLNILNFHQHVAVLLVIVSTVLAGCNNFEGGQSALQTAPSSIYYARPVMGQLLDLKTLQPIDSAQIRQGNFSLVKTYTDTTGKFTLAGASSDQVKLLLPAAGRQFQPIEISADNYPYSVVWLPLALDEKSSIDTRQRAVRGEQAGYIFLDAQPEIIVEPVAEFALPYAAIYRPLRGCDSDAWASALQHTNNARKLAQYFDEAIALAEGIDVQQQLMLLEAYQHMQTAWQMTWASCRFGHEQERNRSEEVFNRLNREAQSMRDAMQLVGS